MDKMKRIYEMAQSVSIEEVRAAIKGAKSNEEKLFYCMVQVISQMEMEDEGQRIQEEYERDLAAGKVPEVPEELDQKCRNLISAHFRKNNKEN